MADRACRSGTENAYYLVTVRNQNGLLINYDSQAPNKAAGEWLNTQSFNKVLPEYVYGNSRIDFYMEKSGRECLMEVKGCTLEMDGTGYFPDAPTERGIKHLHELEEAARAGYRTILAFVIQMNGITEVRPNTSIQPEFTEAFEKAKKNGVEILMLPCSVEPDSLEILPGIVIN